jgi:hypothetical protein
MSKNFVAQFLLARDRSTPLVAIRTPDNALTVRALRAAIESKAKQDKQALPPLIQWDCISGWIGLNDTGRAAVKKVAGDDPKAATTNATEQLEKAVLLPESSILFMSNAHFGLEDKNPNYVQGIWNLRDEFKRNRRQLVMLIPGVTMPRELEQDVFVIDEPLPGPEQLKAIVYDCFKAVDEDLTPPEDLIPKAIDASSGLSAFAAEQITAMSLKRDAKKNLTLDLEGMFERKRQMVEAVPGLTIYRGKELFKDIGGLDNIKKFLSRFLKGKRPPRVVLFMDEIEKMVGGGDTDTSGTTQSVLGKFLSWTQDKNENGHIKVNGMLLLGHAGTGKSIISKACGNEAGVPTILFDLGSVKSSLVGSTEARMDQALKIIDAVGQGEILLLATCNKVENLKPEFRSRFQLATWMFDLPTAEERATIWGLHRKRFDIKPKDEQPEDEGWVGREIESCCQLAYVLNIPLKEAAEYITPSCKANSEAIMSLREKAHGRYLSASYPGPFQSQIQATATGASRAINVDE